MNEVLIPIDTRVTYKGRPGVVVENDKSITPNGGVRQVLYHVRYDVPQNAGDPRLPRHCYQGVHTTGDDLVVL